jgi:hypothetical protein
MPMACTLPERRPSEEEALKFFEGIDRKLGIVTRLRRLKPEGENTVLGAFRDVRVTPSIVKHGLRHVVCTWHTQKVLDIVLILISNSKISSVYTSYGKRLMTSLVPDRGLSLIKLRPFHSGLHAQVRFR